MSDPKGGKPPRSPEQTQKPAESTRPAGRIRHDERGNAVWDWLSQTARMCIDSTSALLRRLDRSDLKMEDEEDQQLRLEGDRDAGGGYDPYNQGKPAAPRDKTRR